MQTPPKHTKTAPKKPRSSGTKTTPPKKYSGYQMFFKEELKKRDATSSFAEKSSEIAALWRIATPEVKSEYASAAVALNKTNSAGAGQPSKRQRASNFVGHHGFEKFVSKAITKGITKALATRQQSPPKPMIDSVQSAHDLIYDVEMIDMQRKFKLKKAEIIMQKKLDKLSAIEIDYDENDPLFDL